MRRTLGALLLTAALATAALAGCADDGGDTRAEDAASGTASGSPSSASPSDLPSAAPSGAPSRRGAVDFTEVALLSETAAGGEVEHRATVLDDASAVNGFAAQFETGAMSDELTTAVREADVAEGQELAAAVVSIGCDVPPGVTVQKLEGGVAILPLKVKSPLKECFAPVTTVALVAVDESAL
jgi:hypothetical protein